MATSNIIINNYAPTDNNMLDYSGWIEGQTGSTSDLKYDAFYYSPDTGSNNSRVLATNPYNEEVVVWQSEGQPLYPLNTRGGYNNGSEPTGANKVSIDNSKTYRYSVWIKKVVAGYTTGYNGLIYGGSRSWVELDDTIATTLVRVYPNPSGATASNTYWFYINRADANTYMPVGEWRLAVGYIYPYGWTGTTLDTRAGLYDMSGSLLLPSMEQWAYGADTNYTSIRVFAPYDELSGATWQNYAPRIDCVDGTEPSIQELINGTYLKASKIGLVENTDTNLIDLSTLTEGTTDVVGFADWTQGTPNAYINRQNLSTTWGNTDLMWNILGTGTTLWVAGGQTGYTAGGVVGDSGDYNAIDTGKTYRYSLWINRVSSGDTATPNELFYFGCYLMNQAQVNTGGTYVTSGSYSTNLYFCYESKNITMNTDMPFGEWRLVVGHIFPSNWSGTTNHINSGVWKPDGTNFGVRGATFGDVKAHPNARLTYWRTYAPYCAGRYANYRIYHPRLDLVDGTEPSIQQLLSGTPETNLYVLQEP